MARNKLGRLGMEARAPHIASIGSERELTTKLQHARIVGGGHLAEVRVVRTRIDILELRVIEGVEAFNTDLQLQALCECKRLKSCQIEVEEPRKDDGILTGVAEALIRSS
jgi:hypothetical protein